MHTPLIPRKKSLIPALDVHSIADARTIVQAMQDVPQVVAYKAGFQMAREGLQRAMDEIRRSCDKDPILIYDHQKAGTDPPDTASYFAKMVKESGFDAAILFPQAGPDSQTAYTKACQDQGLCVIVGGMMTHAKYLAGDGGYIEDTSPPRMYRQAIAEGVTHFVVPGNKPEWVLQMRIVFDDALGEGNYDLLGPGFVAQGGSITAAGKVAGERFHPIIGRGIHQFPTIAGMQKAALEYARELG